MKKKSNKTNLVLKIGTALMAAGNAAGLILHFYQKGKAALAAEERTGRADHGRDRVLR